MSPAPDHEALDVSWDFAWWNTGSFEARGFCSHLQAGWDKTEHRAYVGLLERSDRRVLFDAGYAPRFHDCAAPWLASIYRWATPATIPPGRSVTERLAGLKVDQLLLSHWHADHTGGLLDIPEASVWRPFSSHESVRQEALSACAPLKGILAGQFPDDLPGRPGASISARLRDVEAAPLMALPVDRWPFLSVLDGSAEMSSGMARWRRSIFPGTPSAITAPCSRPSWPAGRCWSCSVAMRSRMSES